MQRVIAIGIIWLSCSHALAQSVDAEGNSLPRKPAVSTQGSSCPNLTNQNNCVALALEAGRHLRVLLAGYEFYLNHANLSKADDFLESFVTYGRYQGAVLGLSPERLLVIAGGTANSWRVMVGQAAVMPKDRPHEKADVERNEDSITDCHKHGDGDFDCITLK